MQEIKTFCRKYQSFLIVLVVILVYFLKQLISFRLGLNYEESRDANAYLLAVDGLMPFRDFEWLYGPFAFFVYPLALKLFGINLITLRISYIAFTFLVIPLTYFLARRIMPPWWAGIAGFLSIVFFDIPYYTFNHVFATLGELACLLMVCRFIETKGKVANLFWAGIFASITALTKPLMPGVELFIGICLFLLLFDGLIPWRNRLKRCLIFAAAFGFLIFGYALYFYFQTAAKDIQIKHPFLSYDSANYIENVFRMRAGSFSGLLRERFIGILPVAKITSIASLSEFKHLLVASFDNFIFYLPYLICAITFIVLLRSKKTKHSPYLLLFTIFSFFISLEGLHMAHFMHRSFVIQVPFVLMVYLLYLIKVFFSDKGALLRKAGGCFIVLFLFYISFLHFFRYPYSMVRKYTRPLNLERARGILVSANEKELYESLTRYLSANLSRGEKIAVMGYYPQFSFLTKQRNVFTDDEYAFHLLNTWLCSSENYEEFIPVLKQFEDNIIGVMQREKPKIVLVMSGLVFEDIELKSLRVRSYLEENYSLEKTLGPADVFGLGVAQRWLKLYKLIES